MITTPSQRPALEVADILREHAQAFLDRYGTVLTATQRQALHDLAVCRTAALGGHVEHCLDCGHETIAYNSCRNRHCPKCQALTRAHWLEQQAEYLLPAEYHHVVFTLPSEVGALALANPSVLYDLLMRSAAATLRTVAANDKHLGAVVGVLMVLHTWGQNLHHHPHVHCVVTGGGLSCDASGKIDAMPHWVACRPGFFLPVRVLSRVFREEYLAGLRSALEQGRLRLPDGLQSLADPEKRATWLAALAAKDWVVYAKPPFGGPQQVLKYLARYTHRVAISNGRLLELRDARVTFRYKDYADGHQQKTMTLTADEFLRRFMQHVLPKGFVKVRHYGLLANCQRAERLEQCRRLLFLENVAAALPADAGATAQPVEPHGCAKCGSTRLIYRELMAAGAPARGMAMVQDSS
jgi:Putative transposase/Transposase zinc-binding domain